MRILSLSFLLVLGCVPVRSRSEAECAPPADGNARAIPLDTLIGLAGRYRMTSVTTAPGYDRSPVLRDLKLTVADTLQRYYEQGLRGPRRTGNRPLVGSLGQEPVVVQQNPGNTQMISGFCTMCTDAEFIYHTIVQVRPNGFIGRWHDPQTGIGRVVDSKGHELPDPKGYFCALRTSD